MISATWLINNFNCLDIHDGLAQFLFLCNQHGQHSQDASTKDINSLANWKLCLMTTFGLIWYYIKMNSLANHIYWVLHHFGSVPIPLQSAWPTQWICKHWGHQQLGSLRTISDGNAWANIILYWNEIAWPIIYTEYCIILALLLFFCYQHGQHNQDASIKDINSGADWKLFLMATFGLTSYYIEIKLLDQLYILNIASSWLSFYSFAISMANITNTQPLRVSTVWLIEHWFPWQHLG